MPRAVLSVADNDRIDALGAEMRRLFLTLSDKVDDGFTEVARERETDRAYLKKVLFEGNGRRAIFEWLRELQGWQDSRDVESDKREKDRDRTKRDTRRFMLDLAKEVARSGVGALLALIAAKASGLF